MGQIRISVSEEIYNEWYAEARKLSLSVAEYAKFRALGIIGQERKPAPVPETAGDGRALGPRIMAEVERQGWEKISIPHDVVRLATLLNAPRRSVHGALGSLVASRKLRRSVYGYHPVTDATPKGN